MNRIFKVNNYKDLLIGFSFLCLLITYLFFVVFSNSNFGIGATISSGVLALASSSAIASYFCVRRIEVSEYSIRFQPINIEIRVSDINKIEGIDFPSLAANTGKVNGIKLSTSSDGFKWIPLNMLWLKGHLSIRLVGLDGKEFHRALSELMKSSK